MHLDKFKDLREDASIGNELLQDSPLTEMERNCMIIDEAVHDGDFTLEHALEIYKVTMEDYTQFVAKKFISYLKGSINTMPDNKAVMAFEIAVLYQVYKKLLNDIDKESSQVLNHLDVLSQDIREGKIAV